MKFALCPLSPEFYFDLLLKSTQVGCSGESCSAQHPKANIVESERL